jgi:hypothetical protein
MKVMVLVKASKDSEAGVMPTQQMWRDMHQSNSDEFDFSDAPVRIL